MISLSIPGAAKGAAKPTGFPLGALLAAQPGLPVAARDALWSAGLLDRWKAAWPTPQPPSETVFDDLEAEGRSLAALAAAADDPDRLHRLVQAHGNARGVADAAAANAFLAPETVALFANQRSTAELVSDRVASQQLLADHVASAGSDADHVAARLIEARQAVLCADLLTARHLGLANRGEAEVANVLLEEMILAGFGKDYENARFVRAAVLDLVRREDEDGLWAELGGLISAAGGACIDAAALMPVASLLDLGAFTAAEVTARIDTDAAALAEFLSEEAAKLVADTPRPTVARRRHVRSPRAEDASVKVEAQAAALLGLTSAASRTALASGEDLDVDDVEALLADADAETFLDWASGSLAHRPADGEVTERLLALDTDRLDEVTAEAGRREGILDRCPELALCLPGAAAADLPRKAGRAIRVHLQRALGDDPVRWAAAAAQVASAGKRTRVVDIVEAAASC